MNDIMRIRTDFLGTSKLRYVQIRPGHALDECERKLNHFIKDRYWPPAGLILGFETYQNLCIDLARHRLPPGANYIHLLHQVVKVTEFKDIHLLVNDEECWGVTFLPALDKAWPRYGKDDWIDPWRPYDVAKDIPPDSPSVPTDR